jgi:hypothetical protein
MMKNDTFDDDDLVRETFLEARRLNFDILASVYIASEALTALKGTDKSDAISRAYTVLTHDGFFI